MSVSWVSEIHLGLPPLAAITPSRTTGLGSPALGYFSSSTLGCVGSQSVMGYVGTCFSFICRKTIWLLSRDQKQLLRTLTTSVYTQSSSPFRMSASVSLVS